MEGAVSSNVELVMDALEAFASRRPNLEDLWHEDGLLTGPEGWPEPGPFEGRTAIAGQFERLAADWAEQRFEDVRVVSAEGDWVVVEFRWLTRGAGSGLEATFRMAGAYKLRLRRGALSLGSRQCLEAAGLATPAVTDDARRQ